MTRDTAVTLRIAPTAPLWLQVGIVTLEVQLLAKPPRNQLFLPRQRHYSCMLQVGIVTLEVAKPTSQISSFCPDTMLQVGTAYRYCNS